MSRLADQIVKPGLHGAFIARRRIGFPNQVCGSRVSVEEKCLLPLCDCFLVHSLAIVDVSQPQVRSAEVCVQCQRLLILLNRPVELMRVRTDPSATLVFPIRLSGSRAISLFVLSHALVESLHRVRKKGSSFRGRSNRHSYLAQLRVETLSPLRGKSSRIATRPIPERRQRRQRIVQFQSFRRRRFRAWHHLCRRTGIREFMEGVRRSRVGQRVASDLRR